MRTEQIIYLSEIHKTSSLHKASDNLHISPQALSLSIRNLEDELNLQVLNRSKTGVTLTSKGLQLLLAGETFLNSFARLQDKKQKDYSNVLQGSLEILTTSGVIETFLPSAISQLYLDCPQFCPVFQILEFDSIVQRLQFDKIKLALAYQISINEKPLYNLDKSELSFHPILTGSYYCMVHKDSPIAHYKTISLNTIAKHPFVIYTPSKSLVLRLLESCNHMPKIIYADNMALYKQLLKDGVGLAVTLILHNSDTPAIPIPNLHPIPIKEKIISELGYLQKNNVSLSKKYLAFIQYLSDFYASPHSENF